MWRSKRHSRIFLSYSIPFLQDNLDVRLLTNNSRRSNIEFMKNQPVWLKNILERASFKNMRLCKSCLFHCDPWGTWLSNGAFTKFLKTHWEYVNPDRCFQSCWHTIIPLKSIAQHIHTALHTTCWEFSPQCKNTLYNLIIYNLIMLMNANGH